MFKIEESFDTRILAEQKARPVVVITEPLDARVLDAVCHLARYIKPVLLASEANVREVVRRDLGHLDPSRVEYTLSECAFVDPSARADLVDEFASALRARSAMAVKSALPCQLSDSPM